MPQPLNSTVAFVTGATSGFGRAIAERLVGEGGRVVISGRRGDRLAELARALGPRALPIVLDVRDRAAVEAAVAALPAPFAEVDLLVNNAGLALGLEPAHRASGHTADKLRSGSGPVQSVSVALVGCQRRRRCCARMAPPLWAEGSTQLGLRAGPVRRGRLAPNAGHPSYTGSATS